ncbi:MAG: molybdopterin-dependent oxidoreductase [Treponema sp.]|nr:molybdopterin-dependent oxidoreductase [Treponema sp.]
MCAKRKSPAKKKILFSDDFYSDLGLKDCLHAIIIESPFSYGKIKSIGFEEGFTLPEGYFLITKKDLEFKDQIHIFDRDIPIFCKGEIAFKGQWIGLLCGQSLDMLTSLKEKISIELDDNQIKKNESEFSKKYKNLSFSFKDGNPLEKSLFSLRTSLSDFSNPKEIVAKRKIIRGNTEEIFSDPEKAAFIVTESWRNRMTCPSNKECDGAYTFIKGGNLHVYTPSLWISQLKNTISLVTGFSKDKIIVNRTKISSENTSSLYLNGILASLSALASIKSGKAVSLSLSRSQQKTLEENQSDILISHKTAVDKSALITAMEVNIDFDAGAFNPFAGDMLDRLAIAACGIYNCKNVKINARAYKSHNPPTSMNLPLIDSHAFFAMENQIQKIAEITGFSPVDIRQMNKAGGLAKITQPFQFAFGRSIDTINSVARKGDFNRKFTVFHLAEKGRYELSDEGKGNFPMRGMGMACAFEGSGYFGQNFEKAKITMELSISEDKKITVHSLPPNQSVKKLWTNMVKYALVANDIDLNKLDIHFDSGITDEKETTKNEIPENLVGYISLKTILLQKCLDSLKRKKIDWQPLSIKKSIPATRKKAWNQETFEGSPYYNTAFGACTVEVEFDKCSFREKVKKICVVIDGGMIHNSKAAESTIRSSIQKCLDSLVIGESVKCPSISVNFAQSTEEPKQIGNIIYSILPAAYVSAISQALNVSVTELPLATDSLYKIKETHERKKLYQGGLKNEDSSNVKR